MQGKIEMQDERYDNAGAAKYLGGEGAPMQPDTLVSSAILNDRNILSRVHDVESIDARPILRERHDIVRSYANRQT
ncbi:MAG: hypothetical protein WCC03_06010 [Candidatus Acidiferrales bacterium]